VSFATPKSIGSALRIYPHAEQLCFEAHPPPITGRRYKTVSTELTVNDVLTVIVGLTVEINLHRIH
jgi:hypothetical protein